MDARSDDFRDEAARASRAIVAAGSRRDPLESGASLCLPVYDEDVKHRTYRSGCLPQLVVCVIVLIIGGLLVVFGSSIGRVNGFPLPMLGYAALLVGLIGGQKWLALESQRRRKALFAETRPGKPLFDPLDFERTIAVGIENKETYSKPKVIGDDVGIMALDPDNRRVLIEGDSYRYVIRGEDVKSIQPMSGHGSTAVGICYHIGSYELKLTLAPSPSDLGPTSDTRKPGLRLAEMLFETFDTVDDFSDLPERA